MARGSARADEASDPVVDFLEHFDVLEDPRQRAKVLYPRDEVLLVCLLGEIAGKITDNIQPISLTLRFDKQPLNQALDHRLIPRRHPQAVRPVLPRPGAGSRSRSGG